MAALREGDVFAGKYRLESLLGRGGMGMVYAARHEVLGQRVAIKLLHPEAADDADARVRFLHEARAAARLVGDHVVRVTDFGIEEGQPPFIVMEYLEGGDLADVLASRGKLPPEEAVDYVLQALVGLAEAHALGIVHRDLKPANLFLARAPGRSTVKVLDFGISKALKPIAGFDGGSVTVSRSILGSPAYASPEQIRNSKTVDTRSDIWSMGVVLFQLLTGQLPFQGDNPGAVFAAIFERDAAPLRLVLPGASEALEVIVGRCLKRDAGARFQNVLELARALADAVPMEGVAAKWVEAIEDIPPASAQAPLATTRAAKPSSGAEAYDSTVTADGVSAGAGEIAGSSIKTPRRSRSPLVVAGILAIGLVGVGVVLVRPAPAPLAATPATAITPEPTPVVAPSATATAAPIESIAPLDSSTAPSASAASLARPPGHGPVASSTHASPPPAPLPPAPSSTGYDPLKDTRR
jgi:serine/threonine-protein kinase